MISSSGEVVLSRRAPVSTQCFVINALIFFPRVNKGVTTLTLPSMEIASGLWEKKTYSTNGISFGSVEDTGGNG